MKINKILTTAIAAGLVISFTSSPASAYWAWGATWQNPSALRYLYVWDGAFTSAQETIIKNAAIQYDSSNTNAISSSAAGSSTLNVNGISLTTNLTTYSNSAYKISLLSTAAWGTLDPTAPAVTCRNSCSVKSTVTINGGNKASVYLNGAFTFSSSFDPWVDKVDFYTVVLHELGHTHGLGHPDDDGTALTSAESRSVMNPDWTIKRTLTIDDVYGLESIY
jgi:hypothetical protein